MGGLLEHSSSSAVCWLTSPTPPLGPAEAAGGRRRGGAGAGFPRGGETVLGDDLRLAGAAVGGGGRPAVGN
eukprot:1181470-Prorocentrum_minimum.AAC.4